MNNVMGKLARVATWALLASVFSASGASNDSGLAEKDKRRRLPAETRRHLGNVGLDMILESPANIGGSALHGRERNYEEIGFLHCRAYDTVNFYSASLGTNEFWRRQALRSQLRRRRRGDISRWSPGVDVGKSMEMASIEKSRFSSWSLGARFDGEFADRSQTYAGTGTIRYTW